MLIFVVFVGILSVVTGDLCVITLEDGKNTTIPISSASMKIAEFSKTADINQQIIANISVAMIEDATFSEVNFNDAECKSEYFTYDVQEGNTSITFALADGFTSWDSDKVTTSGQCNFSIGLVLVDPTKCDLNETTINLNAYFLVDDVNQVPPAFNNETYSIKAAYPMTKGISLTTLYETSISTYDKDFSTSQVTYSVDNENFVLTSLPSSNRNFPLSIEPLKYLSLQTIQTLVITATDDGNPTMTSTATVEIQVDKDLSQPPIPEFEAPMYTVEVNMDDLKKGFSVPVNISLSNEFTDVTVEVTPADYFEDIASDDIKLVLKEDHNIEDVNPLIVTLKATITYPSGVSSSTSVLVIKIIDSAGTTTSSSSTTAESTTESTTDSTTPPETTTDAPPTSTEAPYIDDDCYDGGMVAAVVILTLSTVGLGGGVIFMYRKYVLLGFDYGYRTNLL